MTRRTAPSKRNSDAHAARPGSGGAPSVSLGGSEGTGRRLTSDRRGSVPEFHKEPGSGLLRKEVIQPHLPVRLPCYDFTPIADPTFDGSLPKGLGHRLRVLPTFVV